MKKRLILKIIFKCLLSIFTISTIIFCIQSLVPILKQYLNVDWKYFQQASGYDIMIKAKWIEFLRPIFCYTICILSQVLLTFLVWTKLLENSFFIFSKNMKVWKKNKSNRMDTRKQKRIETLEKELNDLKKDN